MKQISNKIDTIFAYFSLKLKEFMPFEIENLSAYIGFI